MPVVLVGGARLPQRLLLLDRPDHRSPLDDLLEAEHAVQDGEPGAVAEHHARRDRLLAAPRELRPVAGHRRVEVQPSPLREQVGTYADDALGAREDRDDGVLLPRPAAVLVRDAAPQVHDLAPAGEHGDGRA